MTDRIQGSKHWSQLVPKPVFALDGGRCFIGYIELNPTKHVIVFYISEYVERRFEDVLAELSRVWLETATVWNDLVLNFQQLFLALWHAHKNGLVVGDIKGQNIGQTLDDKAVFWDTGHGWCGEPKAGDRFGKQSGTTRLARRSSTHHYAAEGGSNPQGDANLYRASGQGKSKKACLYLTRQDLKRGDERSRQRGRGLGRLGSGTFTFYNCKAAEKRAQAAKENPDAPVDRKSEEEEDLFQMQRLALQVFHQVDWNDSEEWERRATAAAADPEKMLEFLLRGTNAIPQQPLALQRFAEWFVKGLAPGATLLEQMTDLALTMPVLSPEVERGILRGGFVFQGGIAGQVYAGIKKEWQEFFVPPVCVQIEEIIEHDGSGEHVGAGLKALVSLKNKQFVSFYCGIKRAIADGPMDMFPSRFGVSVRSNKQAEKFAIDGFIGRKLTLQWLIDHQSTGAFMNAGDWEGGPRSNVMLDRHNAWTDPVTGIVWIPMYAIGDIAAGDFLRWNYSPVDGEGGAYSFKNEVQKMRAG